MVKFLLLALAFGLAQAADISGDWHTIAIASSNAGKITKGGPLRLHHRHLQCLQGCEELALTFYTHLNGQCQKVIVFSKHVGNGIYRAQYAENKCAPMRVIVLETGSAFVLIQDGTRTMRPFLGGIYRAGGGCGWDRGSNAGDNHFQLVEQTDDFLVFDNQNVDPKGHISTMVYVLGKGGSLDAEQQAKLVNYAASKGIPPENIEDVISTDECPL